MKKVKFTFWLLGFGCGMIVTGVLGTLLTLKIDFEAISSQDAQGIEKMQVSTYEKEEASRIETQENEALSSVEQTGESQLIDELEGDASDKEEMQQDIQEKCEVYIPSQSSANEICTILEKNGVVENGKDFLTYIKTHEKQTKLKNGYLELPCKADYAILLELLLA